MGQKPCWLMCRNNSGTYVMRNNLHLGKDTICFEHVVRNEFELKDKRGKLKKLSKDGVFPKGTELEGAVAEYRRRASGS